MSQSFFEQISLTLADPVMLFGHFTYFLLILSMLMRDIAWLRALAVSSGVAKIIYRSVFAYDPVSILWETLFVIVNLGQLAIMWWRNRKPNFTADEAFFIDTVLPGVSPHPARRLLSHGVWRTAEAGTRLTIEGEPVAELIFLTHGDVDIERGDKRVAMCGHGDFIGEIGFINDTPAGASAIAAGVVTYLAFPAEELRRTLRQEALLRFALQAAFNRNLIGKLGKSNAALALQAA